MLVKKIMQEAAAIKRSTLFGLLGALGLLGFYFLVLTLVSGWQFTLGQFFTYWYFVISLAIGFGIQIGLYTYLRQKIRHQNSSGKIVAVSGTASTVAMISCCSHYLVNILPIIGAIGLVTFAAQYRIQLFWVGIIANLLGILYIGRKAVKLRK